MKFLPQNLKQIVIIGVAVLNLNFASVFGSYSIDDIALFIDPNLNTKQFYVESQDKVLQIFESIKLYREPDWGRPTSISDPRIGVSSYSVSHDDQGNVVVGWTGEDLELGLRVLYLRYYNFVNDGWSSITNVSEKDNIVGDYALTINQEFTTIVWKIYDAEYNVINKSLTFDIR